MFRITSRSHGDPERLPDDNPHPISHWKPALRRIKKRLFSSKEDHKVAEVKPLPKSNSSVTQLFSRRDYQTLEGQSPPRTRDGKRNPSSKRIIETAPDSHTAPTISSPRRHRFLNNSRTPIPPVPVAYAPRRGSQEIPIRRKPQLQRQPSQVAYMPKHAAVDFSKINSAPDINSANSIIQAEESRRVMNKRSQTIDHDPMILNAFSKRGSQIIDDSVDFQLFLASSRIVTAQKLNSGLAPPNLTSVTPRTSRIMDEITANHHLNVRDRATLVSQGKRGMSRSRPVSMAGSVFERVGEYLKPTMPDEARIRRKTFSDNSSNGKSVVRHDYLDVAFIVEDNRRKRRSTISGSNSKVNIDYPLTVMFASGYPAQSTEYTPTGL
ncbi:hypothetical protein G7Y89_g350 [Cudoniella acicularis]|uniref:Uncharacterized protein n=1 Tax=Cudoniella acicularis TaxID=354080 RepID=A0A8H4W812_9HELO|nr:hypothetical protein G7Y89_g350 [Cudoniella acicularis]